MCRYGYETDLPSEEEHKEEPIERRSSLTELGIKITSLIMPAKTLVSTVTPLSCLLGGTRKVSAAAPYGR